MSNLRPTMLSAIFGIAGCLLGTSAAVSDDSTIVIDNSPNFTIDDGVTVPVIGIRPLANTQLNAWNVKGDFSVSDETIIQSAWYTTDVSKYLGVTDINSVNVDDVVKYLKENYTVDGVTSASLYDASGVYIQSPRDAFKNVSESPGGYINASAITRMVVAGAIDVARPEKVSFGGKIVEYFNVNEAISDDMKAIYTDVESSKSKEYLDPGWKSGNAVDKINNNYLLASALAFGLGDITLGKPLVRSAAEMSLVIPPSIQRDFDVYWVDFAVTYRDLEVSSLSEIGFNVSLPEGYSALELIPLRIGIDMSTETKLSTPEIGVEVEGVKLSLGEFYSRKVEFSYVRPTITGFGLQESSFSWSLTEEAIVSGSQRFSAIIGVPRGASELDFEISGKVRTKDTLWGSGTIAGTNASNFNVILR